MMIPALFVVSLTFLTLFLAVHRAGRDWRLSWLLTSVLSGGLLTITVESASALRWLSAPLFWLLFLLTSTVSGAWAAMRWKRSGGFPRLRPPVAFAIPFDVRLMMAGTAAIVLVTFAMAVLMPPTTFDAMTYHLPRVMHWAAQHSVEHYGTLDYRQLESGPWAGFAVLALYLLGGGDGLACVVQWFAMVTTLIGVSLIASQLQHFVPATAPDPAVSLRVAWMAPFLVAMLPIGIAQSMSAQTDYVSTCWTICFAALALACLTHTENRWFILAAGVTLGLGALTKATFLLYTVPLFSIVVVILIRSRWSTGVRVAAVWLVCVVVFNAPHVRRNIMRFGAPLASPETTELQGNADLTIGGTASNLIRNLSLHTGTGSPWLTHQINRGLIWAHGLTGRDLNDKATTFRYTPFQTTDNLVVTDSISNSIYHSLLIALSVCLLVWRPSRYGAGVAVYAPAVGIAFVAFCAYLRWQPWLSRFHLCYYALLMPVVTIVLVRVLPRILTTMAICGFLGLGGVAFCNNASHPPSLEWLQQPREEQYFLEAGYLYRPYRDAADAVAFSGCRNIAYALKFNSWEYPLWTMLQDRGFRGTLESVYDHGRVVDSQIYNRLRPCAVIVEDVNPPPDVVREMLAVRSGRFVTLYLSPRFASSLDARTRERVHTSTGGTDASGGEPVIRVIHNPNGFDTGNVDFFWMGGGPTIVEIDARSAGMVRIMASVVSGPSLPERKSRTIVVESSTGSHTQLTTAGGPLSVAVPVKPGINRVLIAVEDRPTLARLPNGDTRPILLGMHGLRVAREGRSRGPSRK